MNEEILVAMSGIGLVLAVTLPCIVLPLIGLKLFLKSREAKARVEAQAGSIQREYQPASPQRGILMLIGISLLVIVWGLMTGFGAGIFSNLFYIVFLIPLAMGYNSGKMIVDVIKRAKLRTTSQVVLLSVLSAVVIYGTFHYTRYLGFVAQVAIEMFGGFSEALDGENPALAKVFADYALQEETGRSGFTGYMLYRAQEGVSIGRWYRSSRINLGPVLTWLYWLLEFGIIYGVTVLMGKHSLGAPRCESCGSWLSGEKHLGGTASANESTLLDLIRQKDFAGMGRLMERNAEVPSLEVYYQGCAVCGKSPSQLVVRHAFQAAQGSLQIRDASRTVLAPHESATLLSQFRFSGD